MKQIVTDLNDPSEPTVFVNTVVENYTLNSYFADFYYDSSPNQNIDRLLEINNCKAFPIFGQIVHNVYHVNTNFRLYFSSWTLFFDGSKSKYGVGAGCVLIDPKGTKWMIACKLEFECTNNFAEYEALVQGIKKEIDLRADSIQCYGDSEIIVKKVRNKIHCLSPHLLNYQKLVRDMMSSFKSFNIKYVPISQNFDVDLLANTTSRLIPPEGLTLDTFFIELMYQPSIPDSVTSWKIFDDDVQILDFLTAQDTFKYFVIDD